MSHTRFKKLATRLGGARTQFGALCWRERAGKIQVLLISSRRTRRWVVPKGWPENAETGAEGAAREAFEEAGVVGKAKDTCVGLFSYIKHPDLDGALPCIVAVYPIKVRRLDDRWPEKTERNRKWFSQKKAAAKVGEKELARLIRDFDPTTLRG